MIAPLVEMLVQLASVLAALSFVTNELERFEATRRSARPGPDTSRRLRPLPAAPLPRVEPSG